MAIAEPPIATGLAPSERFTGTAFVDGIAMPSDQTRLSAANVRFAPRGAHGVA
jgi:hypothetical protein